MDTSHPPPPLLRTAVLSKRLRTIRGWTQNECALRSGLSLADIQAVEECRLTLPKHHARRIRKLERAFDVPLDEWEL